MNSWFFYFLKRSISQRRGRFIISSTAVMLTVTVVTALITLSSGVSEKIGGELKQYGANMIVTDGAGREMEEAVARAVSRVSPAVQDSTLQFYGTVTVNGIAVEIIGLEQEKMNGYRVKGALPRGADEVMAGITAAEGLHLQPGAVLRLGRGKGHYRVTGIFEKGSDEDASLVMTMQAAGRATGRSGVSAVLLSVESRRVKETEDALHRAYPFLQVKTLRQVAFAEEQILGRIQLLMLLVTAVVLISSIIALGSTMGANVIERREEIGLMKSIGATRSDVGKFFMIESVFSGLAGSLAGYCSGILAAEGVSKTAFGSFIPVNPLVIIVSVAIGLFIAVAATYFPVRDAMKIVPAEILRGE